MRPFRSMEGLSVYLLAVLAAVMATLPCAGDLQAPAAPRNVIFMISDGCGFNHVLAADYYRYGETGKQDYQGFPVRLSMSTFPIGGSYDPAKVAADFDYVKQGFTDSAAAATAMSTGHKSYNAAIGVIPDAAALAAQGKTVENADVDPAGLPIANAEHMIERAEKLGKATGVVTSVPLSHATPAGFCAHNRTRNDYAGIAREMILDSALEVIMGTGHPMFDDNARPAEFPATDNDRAKRYQYVGGMDTWNKLVAGEAGADCDGDGAPDPWTLIQTDQGFSRLGDGDTPKRVIGIPTCATTLQEKRAGDKTADAYADELNQGVPALSQMACAALNVLDNNPKGFFLMIEGGAVDWAGHDNSSGREIEEQGDFNDAVQVVVDWVETHSNWDETLVIVTADHECGYLTGPESDTEIKLDVVNNGEGNMPGMAWQSGNHTNSLVPFYAKGPLADVIAARADGADPRRGAYLDNTVPAQVILGVWH